MKKIKIKGCGIVIRYDDNDKVIIKGFTLCDKCNFKNNKKECEMFRRKEGYTKFEADIRDCYYLEFEINKDKLQEV